MHNRWIGLLADKEQDKLLCDVLFGSLDEHMVVELDDVALFAVIKVDEVDDLAEVLLVPGVKLLVLVDDSLELPIDFE